MATCPNKNLQEWKDLEIAKPNLAYFLWDKYDGYVPLFEYKKSNVNYSLKVINALVKFLYPSDTKRTRKYGETPGVERLTLRINTRTRPNIESNLRKNLEISIKWVDAVGVRGGKLCLQPR